MRQAEAISLDQGEMFVAKIKRDEDPALLRGRGRFVDDICLPGLLHASFVRSPHAHARIQTVSTAAAFAIDGCQGVYTIEDLTPHLEYETLPVGMPSAALRQSLDPPVLALSLIHI